MAEYNSAEKLNMDIAEEYSTDVMTGDRDKRMYLYYQLVGSLKKATSVDIIVSFLMESGKGFFVKQDGVALALRDDLCDVINQPAFVEQMKDVIEYRVMDYYQRRYRDKVDN